MDNYSKSSEYGILSQAMKNGLKEADVMLDLHTSVYSRLEDLNKTIHQWKNDKYPKTMTTYREVKRSEEAFLKAQKPWSIKYNKGKYSKIFITTSSLK